MQFAEKDTKILVVEDDLGMRESIVQMLSQSGYSNIVEAENGLHALHMLDLSGDVGLVCSDVRMPKMDGLQLFHKMKDRQIPFIMMSGYTDLLDSKKAKEMGISEFIPKPFTEEDLLTAIEISLHDVKAAQTERKNLDSEYCRVHIDDFIMGSTVASDVYIRLSASKYLLLARASNPLSKQRLESFKKKGLQYLAIPKKNFAEYVGFNLSIAKAAMSRKVPLRQEAKLHLMKHTTEVLLEDAFVNGVDKESYAVSKTMMESTVQVVSESDDIFLLLEMLKNNSDVVYAHSLAVGVYATLIAKNMGWTSQTTLFKISMAGLMHDIGKKEIPRDVLNKNRLEITVEEQKLYESHTVRGKDILANVPGIPEEVVCAAIQHHESVSGTGFPYQISRARFQPISRLIALTNEFCNLVLKSPKSSEVLSAHEAITRIYKHKKEDTDLSFLKSLMEIFDYKVPNDIRKIQHTKYVS